MAKPPSPIDAYITDFPKETQTRLRKIRQIIRKAAPKAEETISYRIPTFKLEGRYFLYMAGFKNHVGLYPIFGGDADFRKAIKPYLSGKASVRFPFSEPLPEDLVRRIVDVNLASHAERLSSKKKQGNPRKKTQE